MIKNKLKIAAASLLATPLLTTATIAHAGSNCGTASYYGAAFHGNKTASGQTFNMNANTAAHRYLPFGTRIRVKNVSNGRTLTVTINDRGPFVHGRVLDLSRGAFSRLFGGTGQGVGRVCYTIIN